jgi:threonine synthase
MVSTATERNTIMSNDVPLETNETLARTVLDGSSPQGDLVVEEMAPATVVASDHTRSLEERLEAFDDIIDSQVGDTTLARARNTERETGVRQLFLKFEGVNPTGTQKDRIAFMQASDALRRGFDAVTVATCGNYGVAMSLATSVVGLKCYVYVPVNYHSRRIAEMEKLGSIIVREGEGYEQAVRASQVRAAKEEIYDANPGGANTLTQLHAYGQIAYEIFEDLRDAPAAVCVPVSNGTTLAGIYRGFLSLYRRGKTSKIPRMVAGSSMRKNPIVQSWLKNSSVCEDLSPTDIRETDVNEPLVNWHSIDGNLALQAIRVTNGWAVNASDTKMLAYAKFIREREGLNVLPASTAALIALLDWHAKQPLPNDRYVIVLTGKR